MRVTIVSAGKASVAQQGKAYEACRNNEAVQQGDEADEAWSTSELRSLSLCSTDV